MKLKYLFFNDKAVIKSVDKTTRRVLSRFGAYVRRSARSSIRKRKKSAPPGKPPSSHSGLLKRFIFFGYEPKNRSVVIGPVDLQSKQGETPSVLEYGGRTTVKNKDKKKQIEVKARPFMGPAYEKEQPKLPGMWQDAIK
ncbi:hypothetical protein STSP2_01099 [Anaerohalosphaera lusitana]|uniref:Uncharacterized protein n=1 Tax=Anaerohalosphaera lusitana TaxID=1936003 RepID=A0A1U9NJG8_9BACT|nr:hypothetical protein [Anaerohalosphaera lusitana]AQT67947.1 hypothetical protein STSP2_01099 [Anaerohalosphaera lusitana]